LDLRELDASKTGVVCVLSSLLGALYLPLFVGSVVGENYKKLDLEPAFFWDLVPMLILLVLIILLVNRKRTNFLKFFIMGIVCSVSSLIITLIVLLSISMRDF
jgi:predicted Na+-dependent transporter